MLATFPIHCFSLKNINIRMELSCKYCYLRCRSTCVVPDYIILENGELLWVLSHQFSGCPAGPLATLLYWEKVQECSWVGHGDVLAVKS